MAASSSPGELGPVPFIGRGSELRQLRAALEEARAGRGGLWVLRGPGGIGKTWLMRQVEGVAVRELGFESRWAYAMHGLPTPFFLLDQVFRSPTPASKRAGGAGEAGPGRPAAGAELPTLLFVEEDRPGLLLSLAGGLPRARPLWISRENPRALRERHAELLERSRTIWLTRSEGEGHLAPSNLDAIGELVGNHLKEAGEEGMVLLTGLEYLLTQNGFVPTLRLVQHVRDQAEETRGHVLVGLRPGTFEPRERALLTSEGEVRAPGAERQEETEPPDAPVSQRLLRYLDRLERAARAGPQLLLLDDVQWADPLSAEALGLILRHVPRWPVLVIASQREEGAEVGEGADGQAAGPSPMLQVLDALGRDGTARTLDLQGLGSGEVEELCRSANLGGGTSLDVELIDRLRARTDGNPFYLREVLVQSAREGPAGLRQWLGAVGPGSAAGGADGTPSIAGSGAGPAGPEGASAVPPSIRRLVGARLAALSSEERSFLGAVAVLGSTFDEGPLHALSGPSAREDPRGLLEKLQRRHRLLEVSAEPPGSWEFAHPFVWEVVTGGTPAEEVRRSALAFAEWFAVHRGEEIENVARLYHLSGVRDPGLVWTRRARDRARRQLAGEATATYTRWTLDLLGSEDRDREERGRERLVLAEALGSGGKVSAALEVVRGISRDFPEGEVHWRARLSEAGLLMDVRPREAERAMARLLADIAPIEASLPKDLRVEVLLQSSDFQMLGGDPEKGATLAQAGLDLLPPGEASRPRVLLLDHLAWSRLKQRRFDEGLEAFREGARCAEACGESAFKAFHLNGEGIALWSKGEFAAARGLLEDAATLSRAVGDEVNASIHLMSLAHLLIDLGETDRARERLRESLRLAERGDHVRPMIDALGGLAQVEGREGQWEPAQTHLQRALDLAERAEMVGRRNVARTLMAWVVGERGDPSGGLSRLPAEVPFEPALRERVRARLLWLLGRREEALAALRLAKELSSELPRTSIPRGEAQVLLGRCLREMGRTEDGSREEEEGLSLLRTAGRREPLEVTWA